jgi:predicted ATPase/DNA-binding SARP family transcriptional activator
VCVVGEASIRVLGRLEVLVDGAPIRLGGIKQRIVLAMLALRANSEVSRDALIEALWADQPPDRPTGVLQVYVANLRRLLRSSVGGADQGCPEIVSHAAGYSLKARPQELDLLEFRRCIHFADEGANRGDLVAAAEALRRAGHLVKGEPFPDLAEVGACRAELADLEESRLRAVEDLFEIELALGRHAAVVDEAQLMVVRHPFRERLWASLVVGLYRCERQADALTACRRARRLFRDELGLDPGEALQQVEQEVLRHDPALRAPVPISRRRRHSSFDNLPTPVTPMVGREAELDDVVSLLADSDTRLVTVTGAGGIGKTRFALAVSQRAESSLPDGVCWVDLADVGDAALVPMVIAAALGVGERAGADPLEIASAFLRNRHLLLVLDNFEQVDAAWPVVVQLLGSAGELRILVTSRWALQIRGEHELELQPLELPPADDKLVGPDLARIEAVQLFVDRGRAVSREFALTYDNARVISRICQGLDGLPLALELAAAQLRRRSAEAVLELLNAGVGKLPATIRDLPARQQTLHATIAWSCRLLDEPVRDLFEQLGVFAGSPTLEAIEAICVTSRSQAGDLAGRAAALVDHNLLRNGHDPREVPRYSMLQSIREFAREAMATRRDATDLRRRHAEHFLNISEMFGPQLSGPAQGSAFGRLKADGAELRAALVWAAGPDGSLELALRLIGCLWHFWELVGDVDEPGRIAETVITRLSDQPAHMAGPALSGAATLSWLRGRTTEAAALHGRALQAFDDAGEQEGVAWSNVCLAVQANEQGDFANARQFAKTALAHRGASHRTEACACVALGYIAVHEADYANAEAWHRRSVDLARQAGDRWLLGLTLVNLADCRERSHDYANAEALLRDALTTSAETGGGVLSTACVESFAAVEQARGHSENAIQLLAAAATYRTDTALPLNSQERQRIDAVLAQAHIAVGAIRFAIKWAAGTTMTLSEAADKVLGSAADDDGITPAKS